MIMCVYVCVHLYVVGLGERLFIGAQLVTFTPLLHLCARSIVASAEPAHLSL
jgi:hypothetical protein